MDSKQRLIDGGPKAVQSKFTGSSIQRNEQFVPGFFDDLADSSPNVGDSGIGSQEAGEDNADEPTAASSNPITEMDTHEEIINADSNVPCPVSFPRNVSPVVNAPEQGIFPSSAVSSPEGRGEDFVSEDKGSSYGEGSKGKRVELTLLNPGPFAEGDPFLAKLQEIDRAIYKYDRSPDMVIMNGISSGPGPSYPIEEPANEMLKDPRPTPPSPNNRSPLQDISNTGTSAQAQKPRKKKTPKLKPTNASEVCSVKFPALKHLLPYHDETNPQPQKKRATTPNDIFSLDSLSAAAEPQPRRGQ